MDQDFRKTHVSKYLAAKQLYNYLEMVRKGCLFIIIAMIVNSLIVIMSPMLSVIINFVIAGLYMMALRNCVGESNRIKEKYLDAREKKE